MLLSLQRLVTLSVHHTPKHIKLVHIHYLLLHFMPSMPHDTYTKDYNHVLYDIDHTSPAHDNLPYDYILCPKRLNWQNYISAATDVIISIPPASSHCAFHTT